MACISNPGLRFAVHYASISSGDSGFWESNTINNHSSNPNGHFRDCNYKADWSWTVSTYSWRQGIWEFLNNISSDNPILPNWVVVGGEVQGTGNQSATSNQYQNVQYIFNGVWNLTNQYPPALGIGFNQQAPWASWWTPGNPLGYWDTSCGC